VYKWEQSQREAYDCGRLSHWQVRQLSEAGLNLADGGETPPIPTDSDSERPGAPLLSDSKRYFSPGRGPSASLTSAVVKDTQHDVAAPPRRGIYTSEIARMLASRSLYIDHPPPPLPFGNFAGASGASRIRPRLHVEPNAELEAASDADSVTTADPTSPARSDTSSHKMAHSPGLESPLSQGLARGSAHARPSEPCELSPPKVQGDVKDSTASLRHPVRDGAPAQRWGPHA